MSSSSSQPLIRQISPAATDNLSATSDLLAIQDNNLLRVRLRRARQALDNEQQQAHAQAIQAQLARLTGWQNCRFVAATLPFDGEPDLRPFLLQLRAQGVQVCLPRIDPLRKEMSFYLWQDDTNLSTSRFGIAEPLPKQLIMREQIEVMLVPMVGVDRQGNRLGMGAGFYDRFLAGQGPRPYLLGVAHQCQQVAQLNASPWDVPLDGLITESASTWWQAWPFTQ